MVMAHHPESDFEPVPYYGFKGSQQLAQCDAGHGVLPHPGNRLVELGTQVEIDRSRSPARIRLSPHDGSGIIAA
jgi:hypothetical protein